MNAQLVPRKIIVLGGLPKNANGKVVKQELKKWSTNGDCQPTASFLPPPLRGIARGTSARLTSEFIPVEKREIYQSTLEERIAAIWIEVLGISTVAVDDNFLDLGGTFLTAAQVLSRIYRVFDADVSMRSFLENPTLAGLALAVVHNNAKRIDQADIVRILHELTGDISG